MRHPLSAQKAPTASDASSQSSPPPCSGRNVSADKIVRAIAHDCLDIGLECQEAFNFAIISLSNSLCSVQLNYSPTSVTRRHSEQLDYGGSEWDVVGGRGEMRCSAAGLTIRRTRKGE